MSDFHSVLCDLFWSNVKNSFSHLIQFFKLLKFILTLIKVTRSGWELDGRLRYMWYIVAAILRAPRDLR